ncbi:helix-turn-helix transcriptional regulator [Hyphococcus sp.]|uniref:helix-turn-helix transcriptional regulator n=1 Tax=Hyphococcus sp. TaxID=2038636 RepID=UPI0020895584|nr:MAG: hypothetical protein DHS20C04_22320 [Marinicaulis sp.]
MEVKSTADYTAPIHELGQYTAWMRRDAQHAPIDLVWTSIAPPANPKPHWMLPHGEPSIAIRRKRDRSGDICMVDLMICGPFSYGAIYTPAPTEELIGVRLKPETSATIFGIAPGDYLDQAPAEAPLKIRRACSRTLSVAQSLSVLQVINALCLDLLGFGRQAHGNCSPERRAAELLRQSHGRIRCADIAAQLEISERHLRRRFRDHLGCSPKAYANQLRLTAAALTAERSAKPDWARIALRTGFHDQPHMINAFRESLSMSPCEFHRARRVLSQPS